MTRIVALALLLVFFVAEGRLRQGDEARSLEAPVADRGTTLLIGVAFAVAATIVAISPLASGRGIAALPEPLGWLGVALMLIALALRIWSARMLGAAYTRTLRTIEGQRIVRTGPYRVIRHPGYAADILLWAGAGLATVNWLALVIVVAVMLAVYGRRIAVEERMLIDAFGDEYREYSRRTWRLFPPLY